MAFQVASLNNDLGLNMLVDHTVANIQKKLGCDVTFSGRSNFFTRMRYSQRLAESEATMDVALIAICLVDFAKLIEHKLLA